MFDNRKALIFLNALGETLKFNPGEIEEDQQRFQVTIQKNPIIIEFENRSERPDRVVFYAVLAKIASTHRTSFASLFLEANYLWSATGDATIGVNSETDEVMFSHQLLTESLNTEQFINEFLIFAHTLDNWKKLVEELQQSSFSGLSQL